MTDLIFATGNSHKAAEIRAMLKTRNAPYDIKTLSDLDFTGDIAETADTFQGNALIKAQHISSLYGLACFAEDSGLVVPALDGAPGVYSARYAGPAKDDVANYRKLLEVLRPHVDRAAYFQTVVAFIKGTETRYFEGRIWGEIVEEPKGLGGFGYDPIFKPSGYDQTFGELSASVKNTISHRAKAIEKFVSYLARA